VLNPDGTVTVATGTPVGVYTLPYSICEIENPTNCDEALITIEVEGIFDLSLSKQVKAGQKAVFNLNDTVTYVIKVINEGTIDATDIQLVDYIPVGLELVADSNWIELDPKANLATPIALLKAGEELSLEINFKVVSLANVQINNAAEISSAVGGIDRDSTPDENPSNDLAGEDDISTAVIALCPNDGKCLGVKILRKK
jgi:uncharacterized repeat protein (TIGR01451 family)